MTNNNLENYEDEIPVRGASGKFFVVREKRESKHSPFGKGGTKEESASESIVDKNELNRREIPLTPRQYGGHAFGKGGTKEAGIKKLAPLPPVAVSRSAALMAPFVFSAADEEEIRGKIYSPSFEEGGRGRLSEVEAGNIGLTAAARKPHPNPPLPPKRRTGVGEGVAQIKVREIERGKGNLGVNANDIIQKKEEVERDVEEKVEEIMQKILDFRLQILDLARLKNLLKTRIKGARNNLQLWQALVKKESDGGMGMTDKEADDVIKIVSGILYKVLSDKKEGGESTKQESKKTIKQGGASSPSFEEGGRGRLSEVEAGNIGLTAAARKPHPNPPLPPKRRTGDGEGAERSASESIVDKNELNRREIPLTPFNKGGTIVQVAGEAEEDLGIGRIGEEAEEGIMNGERNTPLTPLNRGELGKKGEKDVRNFYTFNRPAGESGKPKIEDIKYKSKLTGPVEEIASLKIKDFRHLSDDPEKAMEIIKNKIDALEEESFSQRIEGIKAWRSSEIYKAYLEMGQRAISEGKGIGEVGGESSPSGASPPYWREEGGRGRLLTEDEFYAIMDLNKRLRF